MYIQTNTAPNLWNLASQSALKTLPELATSAAISALVLPFVATPIAASTLLIFALPVQFAVNTFFRTVAAYAASRVDRGIGNRIDVQIAKKMPWLTAFLFAVLSVRNGQNLAHEFGHAIAVKTLFRTYDGIAISISPFQNPITSFFLKELSPLGEMLGEKRALVATALAGPALALTFSSLFLMAGLALKKRHPNLSKCLITCSLIDFLCHFKYAFEATWLPCDCPAHDFVFLRDVGGISPLVSAITIAALPCLIFAAAAHFSCFSRRPARELHVNLLF